MNGMCDETMAPLQMCNLLLIGRICNVNETIDM